jgi:hypothetical protein
MTCNYSLGKREWPMNLCSAYSIENIHFWTTSHSSTTWCEFCASQIAGLFWLAFPDMWKVASYWNIFFPKNKLSSLRHFSLMVQKSFWRGWFLGFNFCSTWNLYGQKREPLTQHPSHCHVRDITHFPPCLLCGFLRTTEKRQTNTLHSLVTWSSAWIRLLHSVNATSFSRWLMPLVNGFSCRRFFTIICTKPP